MKPHRLPGDLPARALLVGFSGGVDSIVLLDWLHCAGRVAAAAHLNHGLRGAAADADADFCREFCRSRQVPFFSRKVDIAASARAARQNVEAAARSARQLFFAELCAEYNFPGVALAHHADDQAETVFMRLLRGAGWRGLGGMTAQTGMNVALPGGQVYFLTLCRPLLAVTRNDIIAYARMRNLSWREDASNADIAYTRNWLRQRFFPALSLVIPNYRRCLLKFASVARTKAGAETAGVPETREEWGGIFIPWVSPPPPSALILGCALEQFFPRLRRDSFGELEKLISGRTPAVNLPGGGFLRREADGFFALRKKNAVVNDGDNSVWTARTFTALPITAEEADFCLRGTEVKLAGEIPERDNRNVEYLNPAALRWPLTVRPPRPGEKILPLGGESAAQKMTAIFNAAGVPQRLRPALPVLADADGALWLAPLRLARRAAVDNLNGYALRVEFIPRYH